MTRLRRDLLPVLALFAAEKRWLLIAGAALAATTVIAGLALLALSGWFITATAIAGLSAATAIAFDVFAPAAGIRFLALARTASRYGERLTTHDATLAVLAALRERLFRGWAQPQAARRLALRPSRLLYRLTGDIDALDGLYLKVLVPVAAVVAATLVAGLGLAFASSALGLAVVGFVVLAALGIPLVAATRSLKPARRRAYASEAVRSRTIDLLTGQTDLAMAGRLQAQHTHVLAADAREATADHQLNRIETGASLALGISGAALLAGTLAAVVVLADQGRIVAPVAALAVLVAFAVLEPSGGLRRGAIELGRTLLAARRLAPRLRDDPLQPARPAPADGLAVELEGASVHLDGAPRPIVSGIDLRIRDGEHVALVGASGAGKSTLLGLIAREIAPTAGTAAARAGTLLTQRTELFHDSLRENLCLADPDADDDRLWAALRSAGLADDVAALTDGLDSRLGEAGLGLSGGQARRLSLARLFLRDTPLWLLDEPTEGLDGETARDVLARLSAQGSARAIVLATHVRREAAIADRVIVMSFGRAIADHRRGSAGFETVLSGLRPD